MKHFHCDFRVQQLNLHKNWLISFLLEKKSEILWISVINFTIIKSWLCLMAHVWHLIYTHYTPWLQLLLFS